PMSSLNTVRLEVLTINRKHFGGLQRFCRDDERRIRKIHRMVRILFHQCKRALYCGMVHEPEPDSSFEDKIPEWTRPDTGRGEHVKRLGQYRHRGVERLTDFSQDAFALLMLNISRIKQGDDG